MTRSGHKIKTVEEDSCAWELGVEPGMYLVSVNGREVEDIFDYRFLMADTEADVLIREENGEETLLHVEKEEDEDFGIGFESGLMDDYRSCSNRCIFCFIDQLPKGMRKTLYFKDDDTRLSFLQGNYVTLTNMSDHDIDRIIRYRMEPINLSVHTTNPELRVKMLRNRRAGEMFGKMRRLKDAHIAMNGQIVLCRGWNDGEELDRTIRDLTEYLPEMQSVSVVPVGLSRYRDGLEQLEPFTADDACRVIDLIEDWQRRIWNMLSERYVPLPGEETPDLMRGAPRHFIHASDEWYILAGRPVPEAGRYDGFLQYENGVGMIRLMQMEPDEAVRRFQEELRDGAIRLPEHRRTTAVSGMLGAEYLRRTAEKVERAFPGHRTEVVPIRNDFFGERITVTGLITGGDLIRQMRERMDAGFDPGSELLIHVSMLKSGEDLFLDDLTVRDAEEALGLPVRVVWDQGEDFVRAQLGLPARHAGERQTYE